MKTSIRHVAAASLLMFLANVADLRSPLSGRVRAEQPTVSRISESPIARPPRFVDGFDRQFLLAISENFEMPAADDELGLSLLAHYGAALVAGDGLTTAPRAMFADKDEVTRFQRTLTIAEGEYRLQTAAAKALAAAQGQARSEGLSISPNDVDAAARDFEHTTNLWRRRVDRGLSHWVRQGRISGETATRLRSLPSREQTIEILHLERNGLFFSSGFDNSILSSAAPPGASQHLALLAFDVKEHRQARVRQILEEHGWYQTVLRDAPHFTYLGFPRGRLESLGLMMTKDGDREYWTPRRPAAASARRPPVNRRAPVAPRTEIHKAAREVVEIFGHSKQGRTLAAYVLGDGANVTMIVGAFHQDERSSGEVVEALRVYLNANPRKWQGSTIVLVPQTNPDGALPHERTNANGVDLNRNFPGTWNSISLGPRYNPGPGAASEPETRALMRLVEKYAPSKVISIHQPLRCLNWDGEAGHVLAEEMSRYNGYPVLQDIGYPTPGSFGTYCARKGIAMVTLEMSGAKLPTCWRQNKPALLAAIRMKVPPTAIFTLLGGLDDPPVPEESASRFGRELRVR